MRRFFMGIAVALVCAGCAGLQSVGEGVSSYEMAKGTVEQLFNAYASGHIRLLFANQVGSGIFPSKREFIDSVENAYPLQGLARMDSFIDSVQAGPGVLSVSARWEKKINAIDGVRLQQGKGRFVFRQEDGGWVLVKVSGDNPFK